jgi:arylsulfatase A
MLSRRRFLASSAAASAGLAAPARPVNVIVIFCDDLGWGDLSCYGSPIATPNIDRLAKEGARFTHCLSANPVCSPSRAALLTGRYPTRVGVPRVLFPVDKTGLADGEQTMANLLKAKGYQTMCVGKWHLGHLAPHLPTYKGFDRYYGIPYSNDMNPRWLMEDEKVLEEQSHLDTLQEKYTKRAVQFIESAKDGPFFLYMPHTYPHIPLGAGKAFRGKSKQGIYGDVLTELDWSVGQILTALQKHKLDGNTLVLFSSDNGPWFQGSPGMLRGRKGMTWEGGVRVPLLARLPGRVKPGLVCDGLVSTMDLLPTICALTGASLPARPVDGVDISALLSGKQRELERAPILYFDGLNVQCARWGKWKLHLSRYNNVTYSPAPAGGRKNVRLGQPELYDVVTDRDESFDVAAGNPQVVAKILAEVEKLMAGFPEEIRKAYAEVKDRPASTRPAGAVTQ